MLRVDFHGLRAEEGQDGPGSRPTAELWPKSAGAAAGRGGLGLALQTGGRRGALACVSCTCRVRVLGVGRALPRPLLIRHLKNGT